MLVGPSLAAYKARGPFSGTSDSICLLGREDEMRKEDLVEEMVRRK